MNKTAYLFLILLLGAMGLSLTGCIEDGLTTSPSDQPVFSTDTLKMGIVFTDEMTTTHRFTVHNPHNKGLNISDIRLSGENASLFHLNVDGMSGDVFTDTEIRANDSIYVFVEARLPENGNYLPVNVTASVDFTTNGVQQHVIVSADGQDVNRLRAVTIEEDAQFGCGKPYVIYDSLVVAEGATLTLTPGTDMRFHDGAMMIVRGTLISRGNVEQPVNLSGDRTGNVITDITFDLMSRQWAGIQFTVSSQGNSLEHTCIRNTSYGVIVSGDGQSDPETPKLWMRNCRLRNSGDMVLEVYDADIVAIGCEFADAANGCVYLQGGNHNFDQCTFANYYLFSAIGGASLQLTHLNAESDAGTGTPYTTAYIDNCILYGLGTDVAPGDLTGTGVYLRNCLLKSNGSDDANFINCIWNADPLYYTVRNDYIFDYRVKPDSPAIGAGNDMYNDRDTTRDWYGVTRSYPPTLGAYEFTPPTE